MNQVTPVRNDTETDVFSDKQNQSTHSGLHSWLANLTALHMSVHPRLHAQSLLIKMTSANSITHSVSDGKNKTVSGLKFCFYFKIEVTESWKHVTACQIMSKQNCQQF